MAKDINELIDERALRYAEEHPEQYKKFMDLARKERDPYQATVYYYRAFLPKDMAVKAALRYYKHQFYNNTYNTSTFDSDVDGNDYIDTNSFGNPNADLGVFNSVSSVGQNTVDTSDFMNSLFEELSKEGQIYLAAVLLLGGVASSGKGKTRTSTEGLDIMRLLGGRIPIGVKLVLDKISEIEKVKNEQGDNKPITPTQVFRGYWYGPDKALLVKGLLSSSKSRKAAKEVKKAMSDLLGVEIKDLEKPTRKEMSELAKALINGPIYESLVEELNPAPSIIHQNVSKEGEVVDIEDIESVPETVSKFIKGDKVKLSNLIRAIVLGVHLNIRDDTHLSKSKMFSGTFKSIASKYLKLAKSGKKENLIKVQSMLMAPVFENMFPDIVKK